jgi:hypothetical protein
MATGLRAGSFNYAKPIWRGVIREGSYPRYVCTHLYGDEKHPDQAAATRCARGALLGIKRANTLPAGWTEYDAESERRKQR